MNKATFLSALRVRLAPLPQEELARTLDYYSEMIDDRIEDGMSEEEAVASLEDIDTIVRRIIDETPISTLVKTRVKAKGGWSATAIVLTILGFPVWFPLLIAFAAVLLSIYIVVWAVVLAIAAAVLGLILGGAAVLVASPIILITKPLSMLFFCGCALASIGCGVLSLLGMIYAVKGTIWLTKAIGRGIKRMFIRKEA